MHTPTDFEKYVKNGREISSLSLPNFWWSCFDKAEKNGRRCFIGGRVLGKLPLHIQRTFMGTKRSSNSMKKKDQ